MTPAQEQHLRDILRDFTALLGEKYPAGQLEHEGNLWEKSGMLRNAENEVADFVSYLHTIRFQVTQAKQALDEGRSADAKFILEKLLSPTCG